MNQRYKAVCKTEKTEMNFLHFMARWRQQFPIDEVRDAVEVILRDRSREVELEIQNARNRKVRNNYVAAVFGKVKSAVQNRRTAKQMEGFEIDAPFVDPFDDDSL